MRLNVIATALLAGVGAAAAVPALALDGLYGTLSAGADFSTSASGNIYSGSGFGQDFGSSAVVTLGVGAPITHNENGFNVRGEFEIGWHPNFVASHTASNPANNIVLGTKTNVRAWTTMANAYADFATEGAFHPYVGAGLGGAFTHLKPLNYTFNGTNGGTEPGTNKSNFAWALIAGLGYTVAPNALLDLRYKFIDMGDVSSSGQVTLINNVTYTQPPVTSKLRAHEITIGVRYAF